MSEPSKPIQLTPYPQNSASNQGKWLISRRKRKNRSNYKQKQDVLQTIPDHTNHRNKRSTHLFHLNFEKKSAFTATESLLHELKPSIDINLQLVQPDKKKEVNFGSSLKTHFPSFKKTLKNQKINSKKTIKQKHKRII